VPSFFFACFFLFRLSFLSIKDHFPLARERRDPSPAQYRDPRCAPLREEKEEEKNEPRARLLPLSRFFSSRGRVEAFPSFFFLLTKKKHNATNEKTEEARAVEIESRGVFFGWVVTLKSEEGAQRPHSTFAYFEYEELSLKTLFICLSLSPLPQTKQTVFFEVPVEFEYRIKPKNGRRRGRKRSPSAF
jgi:hypothetical protein